MGASWADLPPRPAHAPAAGPTWPAARAALAALAALLRAGRTGDRLRRRADLRVRPRRGGAGPQCRDGPRAPPREEAANALTHGAGALLSLAGGAVLVAAGGGRCIARSRAAGSEPPADAAGAEKEDDGGT